MSKLYIKGEELVTDPSQYYKKNEVYNKDEVYDKESVYTKTEVNQAISNIDTSSLNIIQDCDYDHPFIWSEHDPGTYAIMDSQTNSLASLWYIKATPTSELQQIDEPGFIILVDNTFEETYVEPVVKGYIQTTNATVLIGVTQPSPYDITFSSEQGVGNILVKTMDDQTINGLKTFNTLPRSSATPSNDNDFVTKSYADTKTIQYTTMPTASSENVGKIVQYIGTTTADYTNGYFYQVVSDGNEPPVYSWTQIDIQPEATYNLPIASTSTLGGIKVGDGFAIDPLTGILSSLFTNATSMTVLECNNNAGPTYSYLDTLASQRVRNPGLYILKNIYTGTQSSYIANNKNYRPYFGYFICTKDRWGSLSIWYIDENFRSIAWHQQNGDGSYGSNYFERYNMKFPEMQDTNTWRTWGYYANNTIVSKYMLRNVYGDKGKDSLTTNTQTSIVDAINEVNTKATGAAKQVTTLPAATSSLVGTVYQFVGTTDSTVTHGYFYECVANAGDPVTYSWVRVDVQPGGNIPIATTSSLGGVIPDGTTITVDNDGTIHSAGGGGSVDERYVDESLYTTVIGQAAYETPVNIVDTDILNNLKSVLANATVNSRIYYGHKDSSFNDKRCTEYMGFQISQNNHKELHFGFNYEGSSFANISADYDPSNDTITATLYKEYREQPEDVRYIDPNDFWSLWYDIDLNSSEPISDATLLAKYKPIIKDSTTTTIFKVGKNDNTTETYENGIVYKSYRLDTNDDMIYVDVSINNEPTIVYSLSFSYDINNDTLTGTISKWGEDSGPATVDERFIDANYIYPLIYDAIPETSTSIVDADALANLKTILETATSDTKFYYGAKSSDSRMEEQTAHLSYYESSETDDKNLSIGFDWTDWNTGTTYDISINATYSPTNDTISAEIYKYPKNGSASENIYRINIPDTLAYGMNSGLGSSADTAFGDLLEGLFNGTITMPDKILITDGSNHVYEASCTFPTENVEEHMRGMRLPLKFGGKDAAIGVSSSWSSSTGYSYSAYFDDGLSDEFYDSTQILNTFAKLKITPIIQSSSYSMPDVNDKFSKVSNYDVNGGFTYEAVPNPTVTKKGHWISTAGTGAGTPDTKISSIFTLNKAFNHYDRFNLNITGYDSNSHNNGYDINVYKNGVLISHVDAGGSSWGEDIWISDLEMQGANWYGDELKIELISTSYTTNDSYVEVRFNLNEYQHTQYDTPSQTTLKESLASWASQVIAAGFDNYNKSRTLTTCDIFESGNYSNILTQAILLDYNYVTSTSNNNTIYSFTIKTLPYMLNDNVYQTTYTFDYDPTAYSSNAITNLSVYNTQAAAAAADIIDLKSSIRYLNETCYGLPQNWIDEGTYLDRPYTFRSIASLKNVHPSKTIKVTMYSSSLSDPWETTLYPGQSMSVIDAGFDYDDMRAQWSSNSETAPLSEIQSNLYFKWS